MHVDCRHEVRHVDTFNKKSTVSMKMEVHEQLNVGTINDNLRIVYNKN
jgi:hypothetical protein